MAGTKEGGQKAAATNIARYGKNFYSKIGTSGGKNGHTGGFATPIECDCEVISWRYHLIAECAGTKGGTKSRRRKSIST